MAGNALRKLKPRRRRFVELYLGAAKFNASEAARLAGFSEKARAEAGYFLLRNTHIRAAIAERLDALSMTAEEATLRLTQWGRGSIGPFQRITADGSVVIDLATAEAQENLHLVRELEVHELRHMDAEGNVEAVEARTKIKLHDAKDATIQMLRVHGKFVERKELTGAGGGPIEVDVMAVRARLAERIAEIGSRMLPAPEAAPAKNGKARKNGKNGNGAHP